MTEEMREAIENDGHTPEAVEAWAEVMGENLEEWDRPTRESFEDSYQGKYDSDEEFAQDLAEQIGAIDADAKWPNDCIDWEVAARELMPDYSEENGYYFRM